GVTVETALVNSKAESGYVCAAKGAIATKVAILGTRCAVRVLARFVPWNRLPAQNRNNARQPVLTRGVQLGLGNVLTNQAHHMSMAPTKRRKSQMVLRAPPEALKTVDVIWRRAIEAAHRTFIATADPD